MLTKIKKEGEGQFSSSMKHFSNTLIRINEGTAYISLHFYDLRVVRKAHRRRKLTL